MRCCRPDTPTDGQSEPGAALDETSIQSRGRLVLRRFLRQKHGLVGMAIVLLLVLAAFVGPHFDKWAYTDHDFENFLHGAVVRRTGSAPTRPVSTCSPPRCAARRNRS